MDPLATPDSNDKEFSFKATLLGIILGVLFGAGNAYLGLKIGMTISASIPSAVLSMAILRIFSKRVSILENNIVQTIAAVGEGLAAGVIFTIPAIFLLGSSISNVNIFLIAFLGGILGILFMIPMRRYIIVKEHGILPFPEGTACAEILKASSNRKNAVWAIWGIFIGGIYKFCTSALFFWKDSIRFLVGGTTGSEVRIEGTPALLGVGYIIGPRISALMLAGGALGWWVLIPLIRTFGQAGVAIFPSKVAITGMQPGDIWTEYIRYIGIGCVAIGGIFSLFGVFPLLIKTVHVGLKELLGGLKHDPNIPRTDRDISMGWLILGSFAIIVFLWLYPPLNLNLFTIVLLVILGYFFVTVTSITVGLVGSSSNPASGMVITTILVTCLIFSALGWTERLYLISAITMAALANVAICLASTTSQDLKTGFLINATPRSQQIAEIVGLVFPSVLIGSILILLNQAYGFGTEALPAPQATLISIIVKGVLTHQLPTTLVTVGVILGVILALMRVPILPFAIGLYLPLSISTAIMVGGIVRFFLDKTQTSDENIQRGTLASSGLVAGDAIIGVVIALLTVLNFIPSEKAAVIGTTWSLIIYLILALFLFLIGKKR